MIEDMRVRGFTEKTRSDYVRNVRAFAAFIGRSPDTATGEDLRRFQLHQTQLGMQPPSINSAVAALRFFFTVTLDRPGPCPRLTIVREPRRLPAVLSVAEVTLLLQAPAGAEVQGELAEEHQPARRVGVGEPWRAPGLSGREAFAAHLAPLKKKKWFVYAKSPFAGPEAVLAYLARYTHRVAISNSRLVGLDEREYEPAPSFFTLSKRMGLPHLSGSKGRVQNA
jgi:hypothetical protein